MNSIQLLEALNKTTASMTPTWNVSDRQLQGICEKSLIFAAAADALGFEGQWLRTAAEDQLSEARCPSTETDHIRASLASLAYDIEVNRKARDGYTPSRDWQFDRQLTNERT